MAWSGPGDCLTIGVFSLAAFAGWYLGGRSEEVRKGCACLLECSGGIFYWLFRLCFLRMRSRRSTHDSASHRTNVVLTRLLQCMAKASLDDKSGSTSGGGESGGDSLSATLDEVLSTKEWREHLNYGETDKQMLVLDLDETLIHSSVEKKLLCKPAFLLYDEDQRQHFYVYKRPFVDVFLKLLAPLYHIVVYTASFSSYSDPIIDHIDVDSVIARCLSNNSLVETKLYGLQKDLHLVSREHMPNRLVMIDNSPIACIANQENLYVINSFRANQPHDRELLSLFILLVALHGVDDLRSVVHRRSVFGSETK